MPLYKYVGNRILTTSRTALVGHRAHRVALRLPRLPRRRAAPSSRSTTYSDGFNFDTEIIIQLHEAGKRIVEIPIPTYYGDEICYVNGMSTPRTSPRTSCGTGPQDGLRHRRAAFAADAYELKDDADSRTAASSSWIAERAAGAGARPRLLRRPARRPRRALGHQSSASTRQSTRASRERLDDFFRPTSTRACPPSSATTTTSSSPPTSSSTCATRALLARHRQPAAPGGCGHASSIPNFGHWYPRVRVAAGRFDYDRAGSSTAGHVRFFTRRSFERLVGDRPACALWNGDVGSPIDVLDPGGSAMVGRVARAASAVDRMAVRAPTFFGYQFLYKLERV